MGKMGKDPSALLLQLKDATPAVKSRAKIAAALVVKDRETQFRLFKEAIDLVSTSPLDHVRTPPPALSCGHPLLFNPPCLT
jgi:hypothetical protein